MKKKKSSRRRGCGCSTLILLVIVFAVGIYVGKNNIGGFSDNGLFELFEEYVSRAVEAAGDKLSALFGSDEEKETPHLSEEGATGEFTEIDGVDYTVFRTMYKSLSRDGKYAYEAIYRAALDHEEKVFIPALSEEELRDVHAALKYDNPQIPCFSDEISYGSIGPISYVNLIYTYTEEACGEASQSLIEAAKKLCAECGDLDEYGRELYLHDKLIKNAEYSDDGISSHNAVGALVHGKGVCASYTLAMKLLLDVSGIESCVVRGTAENEDGAEAHVWLLVKIDGNWYHLDPTWNDPVSDDGESVCVHTYFNLTTESISADHSEFTLPDFISSDDTGANYFVRGGLMCGEDDWRDVIRSNIARHIEDGPCDVEFCFENEELYEEAFSELKEYALNEMIRSAVVNNGLSVGSWTTCTQTFEGMNTVHYIITLD